MVSVIRSPQVGQPFDYSAEKVARKVSEATGIKNTRHLQELVKDVIEVFYFPYVELKNKELLLPPARPVYDIVENAKKYKSEMAPKGITDGDLELSENAAETYLIGVLDQLKEKYRDVYEDVVNYIESEGEQGEGQQGQASEKKAEKAINEVASKIADKIGDLIGTEKKLKDIGGKLAGKTPGTHGRSGLSPEQLEKMALNARIRELLKYMEGMDVSELVKKAIRRTPYGEPEGIEGITTTHNIENVMPSQYALPEEEFYRRLAEGELLGYEKYRKPPKPLLYYVLLDISGSMENPKEKELWSKTVAAALLMKAAREGSKYCIGFFEEKVVKKLCYPPTQPLDIFSEIATIGPGGGTNIQNAILYALDDAKKVIKQVRETVIYLITDGEDRVNETLLAQKLKEEHASLITVMTLGYNESLEKISKAYFEASLDKEGILKVLEAK